MKDYLSSTFLSLTNRLIGSFYFLISQVFGFQALLMIIGCNRSGIKFKVEKVIWSGYYVFFGEVSEWLKEQPWKGCVRLVCTAGSNPALSVKNYPIFWKFFLDNALYIVYNC